MYCTSIAIVLLSCCWKPKLNMRISGLCRLLAIGRTRPQFGGQTGPTSAAAGGKLGNAAATSGQVGLDGVSVTVRNVLPSKFKESRTTLLKASMVTSPNDALNNVPSHGAKVKPRRGCQLLVSDEQAGIIPLPSKQVPFGPFTVPPLKAPASRS